MPFTALLTIWRLARRAMVAVGGDHGASGRGLRAWACVAEAIGLMLAVVAVAIAGLLVLSVRRPVDRNALGAVHLRPWQHVSGG